jgi:hypothetical protein
MINQMVQERKEKLKLAGLKLHSGQRQKQLSQGDNNRTLLIISNDNKIVSE